jgi:hypothetical protein
MIQQRRAKEGQMLGLHSYIQDDHRLRHKAEWESKSDNLVTQASVSKRFQELRAVHSQHLEARRQKLSDLLRQEEDQYRQEYINKQETPEDIRRRMAERLEVLKNSREAEKRQEVFQKLDQRWRDSADELRTQEGKLAAMHCRLHQETQMWEKLRQEEENREEEKIFNELWIEDKKKKDRQELERLAQKEKLNSDRLQYLNWQRQLRDNQRKTMNEREQVEKQMLNEEWENEKLKEQALKRERDRLMKERNLEIIQHNELTKQLKADEEQRERDLDRQLIDEIVKREEYEERLELEERVRRRMEAKEMIKHYNLRAKQEGDMEKMIEEYAKAENDEQWRRLDLKWDMEEKARILLMTEVYESRAREIQDKRKKEAEEKERDRIEKERIRREVAQGEELERMRKTAIRDVKVQNQDHLKWQIEEKNVRQQKALQEEMLEKRAAKMAEIQYQRKLEDERKKGMEVLDALRAKRPY